MAARRERRRRRKRSLLRPIIAIVFFTIAAALLQSNGHVQAGALKGGSVGAAKPRPTATDLPLPFPAITVPPAAIATTTPRPTPSSTPSPSPTPGTTIIGAGTGGSNSCPSGTLGGTFPWVGKICLPFNPAGWIGSLILWLYNAILATVQAPIEADVQLLTYVPDFTTVSSQQWAPVDAAEQSFNIVGSSMFFFFFQIKALKYLAENIWRGLGYGLLVIVGDGLVIGFFFTESDWILHLFFLLIQQLVAIADAGSSRAIAVAFVHELSGSFFGGGTSRLLLLLLAGAMFIVNVIVILMRLSGMFILALFFIISKLGLALMIGPPMVSGIGEWWLRNIVSYSLWPLAYALLLKVIILLGVTLPHDPYFSHTIAASLSPFVAAAGLLALMAPPGILQSLFNSTSHESLGGTHAAKQAIGQAMKLLPFLV